MPKRCAHYIMVGGSTEPPVFTAGSSSAVGLLLIGGISAADADRNLAIFANQRERLKMLDFL